MISIEYNGFTFDNTTATIEELTGITMPDIRSEEEVMAEQDTALPTSYRYGGRTFGWAGTLFDDTAADYQIIRDAMIGALNMQNQPLEGLTMTFTLVTGEVRTLREVRPIGEPDVDFKAGEPGIIWNTYKLAFRSTFGWFEGSETDATQQITDSGGYGVVIPAPVASPLSPSTTVSAGTDPLTVTNAGNANAYPIFTISGPGTNFTITNSTTGHVLTINESLSTGDTITIDTRAHTIVKNGSENILAEKEDGTAWIYIQPGNNTLTFTADSGTSSDTQVRTVFNNTYCNL